MDIFEKDKDIQRILDKIRGIPGLYNYVANLPPEFVDSFLSYFESNFDIVNRADTVVDLRLKKTTAPEDEEWVYSFAEPYPGISVICARLRGLDKLDNMSGRDEEMRVSVLHYCRKGRCELYTNDGRYAFSHPGVLCQESRKFKKKNFDFHGEEYEYVEIAFRLDEIGEEEKHYLTGLGLDVDSMQKRYDDDANFSIGNVSDTLKAAEEELAGLMRSEMVDNTSLLLMILRINNLIRTGHVIFDEKKFFLTKGQREIVNEIRNEIDDHPDTLLTVENFSEKYGISVVSLNKYFNIMYGNTIHKYIQKYRMDIAAKSLRTTKSSVAEIAAASGYENQGKFGSVFKKMYGLTPLEYRRQNLNCDLE